MFPCLNLAALGHRADLGQTISCAVATGWPMIDLPIIETLAHAEQHGVESIRAALAANQLQTGGWSLPFNWRTGPSSKNLDLLRRGAQLASALGCVRCHTWVPPASDERRFHDNVAFHIRALQPMAAVLDEYGCRLALEFIGPRHMREERQFAFISTLDGMLCLAQQIGPNVGLLLDSYHWYTSLGTTSAIRALRAEDVVYVHVNDAPDNIPVDQQQDQVRRLPGATGVIDIAGFLAALREIRYTGPITAEPFDQALSALTAEHAAQTARAAMRQIVPGA